MKTFSLIVPGAFGPSEIGPFASIEEANAEADSLSLSAYSIREKFDNRSYAIKAKENPALRITFEDYFTDSVSLKAYALADSNSSTFSKETARIFAVSVIGYGV